MRYIPLRLIRKLADRINGFDRRSIVGDVIEVRVTTALMLMGEGWAAPLDSSIARLTTRPHLPSDSTAASPIPPTL